MIPRARDLRKLWFEWPESRFGRFNFQREKQIDALAGLLITDQTPAVVVLGGEPGIGRGFLCEAAAQRARERGHEVGVWSLDLDGFEPDIENPLTHYLRHLVDQQQRELEASRDKARGAVKSTARTLSKLNLIGQASEIAASLLSLLWQFEDPLKHLSLVLSRPSRGNVLAPRDDRDSLHRFLVELTRDRKVLVHVKDGAQLTSHLRRWLIREVERAPERLLLAISCHPDQPTNRVAPDARHELVRIDVVPLSEAELRKLLDLRFGPNELPDGLVQALMHRCQGRPVAIANLLADLMEVEILLCEGGVWRLPPAGIEDKRLVDIFSRGLFEEVDERLAALAEEQPKLAGTLRELLFLAALCGPYVPIAVLLEHLQLDKVTAEQAIDWLDDVLVEELGWLTDLGFRVVGVPGYNVYAFTNPLLPRVVLDQESEVQREMRAAVLLPFLEQRVQVTKRGWARLFLTIAEHLGERECAPYKRSLGWWVGMQAADDLRAEVRTAIERGEVDPELVWRAITNAVAWPAYRRFALLEGYSQAVVGEGEGVMDVLPFDRRADYHLLRSELLEALGRYREALADAQQALKLCAGEPLRRAQALNCSGLAQFRLGDAISAGRDLEEALLLCRSHGGGVHLGTLAIMNNLSNARSALGDLVGTRTLQEQALRICRHVLGEENRSTLLSMNNLATTLEALGDLAGARELHERTLEVKRRMFGEDHRDTLLAMSNLATTLHAQGDLEKARLLTEQALAGERRVLGEEHPDTLTSMGNLGAMLNDLGDFGRARDLTEEILEVKRRVLGEEHPSTLLAMSNVAAMHGALGDFIRGRQLVEQVLKVQSRVLGETHPDTLNSMSTLVVILHSLDDFNGARKLAEQVLKARHQKLGEEHPDTLKTANDLAFTLRASGDLEGARRLAEHVLRISRRVLGEDHRDTLTTISNLAGTLRALGDLGGARKMIERVLGARRRVLGEEHPQTLESMNNLAWVLYGQGQCKAARDLMARAVEGYRRVFGEEHPETQAVSRSLRRFEADAGD